MQAPTAPDQTDLAAMDQPGAVPLPLAGPFPHRRMRHAGHQQIAMRQGSISILPRQQLSSLSARSRSDWKLRSLAPS